MEDLTEHSYQLIVGKVDFVTLRIFEVEANVAIDLGLAMIVSQQQHWGSTGHPDFDQKLVAFARESLLGGKSRTDWVLSIHGRCRVFAEVFLQPETIVIAGAGHIAVPLAQMAKIVGYRVIVVDDRPDYANPQRFPMADQIVVGEFGEALAKFAIEPRFSFVLITRGHTYDKDCLRVLLSKPVAYIGMIGSLRRIAGVKKLLEREGFPATALAQIHSPIGLPIGGDRPEEIALGILAEIVSVRYRGAAWSLALKEDFVKLAKRG